MAQYTQPTDPATGLLDAIRNGNLVYNTAMTAHAVNRAYIAATGGAIPPEWDETTEAHKQSLITGVNAHFADDNLDAAESHKLWLEHKQREGWQWGPEKDEQLRLHPCFLPYDQLPREQQVKDYLFKAVCTAAKKHI